MAGSTRAYGANARRIDWEDEAEQGNGQRTGGWIPLDALDDDPRFSGAPQLQAIAAPAPRRHPGVPWRGPEVAPSRPQRAQAQTKRQESKSRRAEQVVQVKAVAIMMGIGIMAVALYMIVSAAAEWTQIKLDDLQYGRPRTMQIDAYVGHNEAEGVPSHFVAMNLNRRVTILEMPGGDSSKVVTILGPYLFGQGEELTPVQVGSQDLNEDGRADLIVSVKNEQLLYLNDGAAFKLATPEEQISILKALAAKASKGSGNGHEPQAGAAGK